MLAPSSPPAGFWSRESANINKSVRSLLCPPREGGHGKSLQRARPRATFAPPGLFVARSVQTSRRRNCARPRLACALIVSYVPQETWKTLLDSRLLRSLLLVWPQRRGGPTNQDKHFRFGEVWAPPSTARASIWRLIKVRTGCS